jgi:hypothetical protein
MNGVANRIALLCLLALAAPVHAQIYECRGEDGSRVFSDEKCGPDAKVVSGVTSKKRAAPASSAAKPKKVVRPPSELEVLSAQCDAGDMKACREWTLGGGPNLLRTQESKAELACEAGSLEACESRYCKEGVNADCRASVLRTAKLAGETWYLRDEERGASGVTRYQIRCVPEGKPAHDVVIQCQALAGPNRCFVSNPDQGFSRLDRAAAKHCEK